MDVNSTFLNGILKEQVYVEKPPKYMIKRHEDKVYLLKKSLYSLKQDPKT